MAKIIFLNRFFFPDHSATSQILSDLAFELATCGHDVHVIASQALYGKPGNDLASEEVVSGVKIHRTGRITLIRNGIFGRLLDYISYYCGAMHRLRRMAGRDTVIVAKTDPPLLSIMVRVAMVGRRYKQINWLQDIYPEVGAALSIPLLAGPVGKLLARLRDRSLRKSTMNVVLGSRMAEFVVNRGVEKTRVTSIHNWVDDRHLRPVDRAVNPLRNEWGLADRFVVGYSGNLGRAHEAESILSAAEVLKHHDDIRFLFIGGGFQYHRLEAEVRKRGLEDVVIFRPYQAREDLDRSLSVADVHWLSLRPDLEGLIVPSKFYGIAAVARPVVSITDLDGDTARLVRQFECGIVVRPGDVGQLVDDILALKNDTARRAMLGTNARAMIDQHFSRDQAFVLWKLLIQKIETATPQ